MNADDANFLKKLQSAFRVEAQEHLQAINAVARMLLSPQGESLGLGAQETASLLAGLARLEGGGDGMAGRSDSAPSKNPPERSGQNTPGRARDPAERGPTPPRRGNE